LPQKKTVPPPSRQAITTSAADASAWVQARSMPAMLRPASRSVARA
jgi:hypothetical protein